MTLGEFAEGCYKSILISKMAAYVAEMQAMADTWYYEHNDLVMSSHYLEKVDTAKDICDLFECTYEVWQKAKMIYDFTNSGREGYTLKNGKIVQLED